MITTMKNVKEELEEKMKEDSYKVGKKDQEMESRSENIRNLDDWSWKFNI